jgi:hypothetical protein
MNTKEKIMIKESKMKANVYENVRTADRIRKPMPASRKIALAGGVFYLLTFVAVPQFALYASVRKPNYIVGPGPDTGIIIGGILEIIVALAGIATAVVLFPALKRQNEVLSLGLIGARILEAATIFAGVVSLMTIVTLRKSGVGAEGLITAQALIAQSDWFHLGQAIMPAVDDLLLGYLLYRSRLVPRLLPELAFIGVPVLIANTILLMFGTTGLALTLTTLGVIPIATFEFGLGVYLIVKGFKPTAITAELDREKQQ